MGIGLKYTLKWIQFLQQKCIIHCVNKALQYAIHDYDNTRDFHSKDNNNINKKNTNRSSLTLKDDMKM